MVQREKAFPIRVDLTGEDGIVQGMDWYRFFLLTYLAADGVTWETWPDDTYTGVMTVRADYDSDVIFEATTTNGYLEIGEQGTDPNLYTIAIALPNSLTSTLEDWGRGVWDLFVTDSFGHETMLYRGKAELVRKVRD